MVGAFSFHQCGLGLIPGVHDAIICKLSLLLVLVPAVRVFLRVLRFSSIRKNHHFQNSIRPGSSGRAATLDVPLKFPFYLFLYFIIQYGNTFSGRPILTGGRQVQTPPIPMRPVYSNSRASMDPQGNRLGIMFTSLV